MMNQLIQRTIIALTLLLFLSGVSASGENCSDIRIYAEDITISEDTVEYFEFTVYNYEDRDFDVETVRLSEEPADSRIRLSVNRTPSEIDEDDEETIRIRVETENFTHDDTINASIELKGRFEGNGEYCSFSEIGKEYFDIDVEEDNWDNDGEGNFYGRPQCDELELGTSTVKVEAGKTVNKEFTLENRANERFYIDFVDVYDNSSEIRSDSDGYDRTIYSNSVGTIGVEVKAYSDAEEGREKAYIKVRGHFQDEATCTLEQNARDFYVNIEEKEEATFIDSTPSLPVYSPYCSGFIFTAPSTQEINERGEVSLRIENNTPFRASIRFYGNGLRVEPQLLSIPSGFKSNAYQIEVSADSASTLYYEIDAGNCLTKNSTRIIGTVQQTVPQQTQQNEEPVQNQEPEEEETVQQQIIGAIAGSGFAVLGNQNTVAGLMVVALLIIAYAFVVARNQRKGVQ